MPSLSGAELSLCREITEEIKSESDLSSLLSGLCSAAGPSAHSRRATFWPKLSCCRPAAGVQLTFYEYILYFR